jgi:hypothetical protein
VTFVQRFGSAANLNLHFHIVVFEGVFTAAADHSLRFHPAAPRTEEAIAAARDDPPARPASPACCALSEGSAESADRLPDEAPLLAACCASSIGRRRTWGARADALHVRIGAGRSAPWVERGRQRAGIPDTHRFEMGGDVRRTPRH